MKYTVEWFNEEVATETFEAETLDEAKEIFNRECLNLRMSSYNDQKKYVILLSEIDENEDCTEIDSFSI